MSKFFPQNETFYDNSTKKLAHNFVELNSKFEEGINAEKMKKVEMRKDAIILLNLKQKYQMLNEKYRQNVRSKREAEVKKKYPHYYLKNGIDLFDLKPKQLKHYYDIYEMSFKELEEFDLNFLSYLPNFAKLDVKFSNIFFSLESNFFNKHDGGISIGSFYPSLLFLDLPCNNLTNEILNVVQHIPSLKSVNLMGNRLTGEIPEMFTNLKNLEELNLSHNLISSNFINLGELKNVVENEIENFPPIQESIIKENEEIPIKESLDKTEEEREVVNKISTGNNDDPQEISNQTKETFEVWQKYLKTNLQPFYHSLSQLPNLKALDLSHNKIHFFDIDPFFVQKSNGFRMLTKFNMSHNLIEEEISILLVMNIPNLQWLDITFNPIIKNKTAYKNIEYEIFKSKNILLAQENDEDDEKTKGVTVKKNSNSSNLLEVKQKPYKIKKYKLVSQKEVDMKVKALVAEISETRKKIEMEEMDNPDHVVDILETNQNDLVMSNGEDEHLPGEIKPQNVLQLLKKNKEDLFITNEKPKVDDNFKRKYYPVKVNTYDEFLALANKCFGKERHYKQKVPLAKAYQRLRFLVSNFQTEANEIDVASSYMKPTISQVMRHDKLSPSKDNLKKEYKMVSKGNKHSNSSFSLSRSLENLK